MQVPFRFSVCTLAVLVSVTIMGETDMSGVEGQLVVPNITQREEPPESNVIAEDTEPSTPEEQMAMKALFSRAGQLYGFGLNVNNGSLLCPTNGCEFRFDEGTLRQGDDNEYILEGNLHVKEKE
jgi:hypothetical protein